jgi:pentafunctional AROM polypeptide
VHPRNIATYASFYPARYLIPLGPYSAPTGGSYDVEADASSASYPAAAAALTGRTVVLEGVGRCSTQGDAAFPLLLARMGCDVQQEDFRTFVSGPCAGAASLQGIDCDMSNETDCFMTLAVVAAAATGTTTITGIANQRVKECNRIEAMVRELAKCGVVARELPDGIEIVGSGMCASGSGVPSSARGGHIHCYGVWYTLSRLDGIQCTALIQLFCSCRCRRSPHRHVFCGAWTLPRL